MKKFKLSSTFYYIPIILMIFVSIIIPIKYYSVYTYAIKPLFWLCYAIACYFLLSKSTGRYKYKTGKAKTIIIWVLFYLIIWFGLGLIFGYTISSYSHSFFKVIRNIWCFVLILFFKEFVRMKLIENDHSTMNIIMVIILFFINDISINSLINNTQIRELAFQYLSGITFPILVDNILLTYLTSTGGYKCALVYSVPLAMATILLPIIPNLDWFFEALVKTIIAVIVGLSVYRDHQKKVVRSINKKEKKSVLVNSIEIAIILILALFVAGIFKYQPVAVLTYSMKPVFTRGDAVIIEKLNNKEKKKLKVNDVIQYQLGNYVIIHRIIKIEEDRFGNLLFTTKGDHNKTPDDKKVKLDQIMGIARFYIPKFGYPSVWLNEFFNEQKDVGVET